MKKNIVGENQLPIDTKFKYGTVVPRPSLSPLDKTQSCWYVKDGDAQLRQLKFLSPLHSSFFKLFLLWLSIPIKAVFSLCNLI